MILRYKYIEELTKNALNMEIKSQEVEMVASNQKNSFYPNSFINIIQIYQNETLLNFKLKLEGEKNVDFYYNDITTVYIHNQLGYVFFLEQISLIFSF